MTFLNPLALFGLLAAALPILLHLFNLRKLRTIDFSTLVFLKELQKTRIRRLKIRQILLLILRTLLVLLVVLAFARPTLQGTIPGALGSHARTTAVFIIDDSYSMSVNDDHGELLKQAKQAAEGVNHLFAEGDEIYLLRLSALNAAPASQTTATRDFAVVRKGIADIKQSAIRHSLEDGLRVAARLLASTQNFNREIYLFSDFQSGVLTNGPAVTSAMEHLFDPNVRLFLVPFGKSPLENVGVASVTIPTSVFEREKPFVVRAQITNYSDNSLQDHMAGVFLNGTRVAERSLDLPKQSTVPVEFSVAAGSTGYVQGFVEIEDDAFPYDNRRFFVVHIPDQIRVLLVGNPHDIQYPKLALDARAPESASVLTISVTAADRLNAATIRRSDVIVLCTSEGFSAPQISELRAFVRDGGGLALFPGMQLDPEAFNRLFGAALSLPRCINVEHASTQQSKSGSFTEFDKVELRHPIFEGMFSQTPSANPSSAPTPQSSGKQTVESPRIRSSVRFAPAPRSTPIITLTNGSPFLTEHSLGSGTIFLFAVPTGTEWSDFPLKGFFVPLLHRTVLYLGHQQSSSESLLPGEEVVLRTNTLGSDLWTIRNPKGVEATAAPTRVAMQRVLRFTSTDEPGVYDVLDQSALLQKFVVNLDPRESQLKRATPDEIDSLFRRLGIEPHATHTLRQSADLERSVLESRFGVELWKYFLMLALAVAIIEQLVARTTKRERGAESSHD